MHLVHLQNVIFLLNIFTMKVIGINITLATSREGSIYDERMVHEDLISESGASEIVLAGIIITKRYILTIGSYQQTLKELRTHTGTRILISTKGKIAIPGDIFLFDLVDEDIYSPDIGLIQMVNKLVINEKSIAKIRIPMEEHRDNVECIAVTWDRNESHTYLYEYKVRTYTPEQCAKATANYLNAVCFTMAGKFDNPCKLLPGSPIICSGVLVSIVAADPKCKIRKKTKLNNVRLSAGIFYAKEWIRDIVRHRNWSLTHFTYVSSANDFKFISAMLYILLILINNSII